MLLSPLAYYVAWEANIREHCVLNDFSSPPCFILHLVYASIIFVGLPII